MENNNLENQNVVQPVEPEVQAPVMPEAPAMPETPVAPTEPAPIAQEVAPVTPEVAAPAEPVFQPTMDPMMQPAVQPIEQEAKKKKNILPIIIIVAILVIAGAGAAVYFMFFNKVSGKQVMDGTIAQLFSKAEDVGSKVQEYFVIDYKNDIVHNKGDLVLNAEIKAQGASVSYKDVKFNYDTKINLKDLEGSFKFGTSQEGNEIANIEAFLQKKVFYANSNLFENPYKYDLSSEDWTEIEEYIKNMPDYKTSSYSTLIKKSSKILQNAIKEDYITQTEGNFTIEGVAVNGLKNTLVIDGPRSVAITKDVFSGIRADSEYVDLLTTITGNTKEEIIKSIDDELSALDETKGDPEESISISIYTTKAGKFLAMEVVNDTTSLTAVSENNVTTFRYKEENKETYKFTYNEVEKEFTFNIEEGYVLKIKFIDNGIKFSVEGEGITVDLSLTSINDGSSVKSTLESNLKYTEGKQSVSGNLKFNTELKKADKIDTFATTNAKPFEEMTAEESQAMMTKLTEKAQGTYMEMLLSTVQSLTTVNTSTPYTTSDPYSYSLDY